MILVEERLILGLFVFLLNVKIKPGLIVTIFGLIQRLHPLLIILPIYLRFNSFILILFTSLIIITFLYHVEFSVRIPSILLNNLHLSMMIFRPCKPCCWIYHFHQILWSLNLGSTLLESSQFILIKSVLYPESDRRCFWNTLAFLFCYWMAVLLHHLKEFIIIEQIGFLIH